MFNRRRDCIRVLQCQMLVIQKHVDRCGDLTRATLVDRRQNPRGFGKHEMRNPGPRFHEVLSRRDLLGVVARDETNQNVRVNGPHGAS
jgi:hypothetical protein